MEIRKTLMFSSFLNSLLHATTSAAATAATASSHKILDVVQHLGLHVRVRHSEHGRGDALGCSVSTSDIAEEVGGGQREGDDDEDDPLEVEPGERHQEEHRPQRRCQDQTAPKDAHLSTSG